MVSNDSFYGLVFERDRVLTLLNQCSAYELSAMLKYMIDRRFPGWNKADECFRAARGEIVHYDTLHSFFLKGKITFADLLAAYNLVTDSSINPKFQSYYVPAGTVIEDDTPAVTDDFEEVQAAKKIAITNPRWEHVDASKKKNSQDCASRNDSVKLLADIQNYTEGGVVTFTIYDVTGKTAKKIASIDGKNSSGIGQCEWVVDFEYKKQLKLAFDASANDSRTDKLLLKIKVKRFLPSF